MITGGWCVISNAVGMPYQENNCSDGLLDGLTRLADAIHSQYGKVVARLAYGEAKVNPDLLLEKGEIWSSSAVPHPLKVKEAA